MRELLEKISNLERRIEMLENKLRPYYPKNDECEGMNYSDVTWGKPTGEGLKKWLGKL